MDQIDDIVQVLRDEVGERLRSVVTYTDDDYDVLFIREDVAVRYDEAAFEEGIEEMRFETLEREYVNDLFSRTHGELRTSVTFFDDAVEMNFPVDDCLGVSVAVDAEYFTDQNSLVRLVEDRIRERELAAD